MSKFEAQMSSFSGASELEVIVFIITFVGFWIAFPTMGMWLEKFKIFHEREDAAGFLSFFFCLFALLAVNCIVYEIFLS